MADYLQPDYSSVVSKLFRVPRNDKRINTPRTSVLIPHFTQQADLLYLPNDHGYKYALIVVDLGNRKIDAVPLKSKMTDEIVQAFEAIYKRKILRQPVQLEVDPGKEFSGNFQKWADKKGIKIWRKKPGRRRQQAMVETVNGIIATALHKRIVAEELITGRRAVAWVQLLPGLVTAINDSRKDIKVAVPDEERCSGDSCILLSEGTRVRRMLDEPIDIVTKERVNDKFRRTDVRWDPTIRTIVQVIIKPGQPPMYLLNSLEPRKKYDPVAYTKNQLQIVTDDEQMPLESVVVGDDEYYIPEKIIGKKKMNNRIYYLIKWKDYPKSESTWEPRTKFNEDYPVMVRQYENLNK